MLHGTGDSDRGIEPLRRPDGASLRAWRADPVLSALPDQFALSRAPGRPLILAAAAASAALTAIVALRFHALVEWLHDGRGGVIQKPGELPIVVDAETGPRVVVGAALMILICFSVALVYHWQSSAARWKDLETGRRLHTRRRFVTGGVEDAAALLALFRAGDLSSLPSFTGSRHGAIRVTTHTDSSDKRVFLTITLARDDDLVAAPLITLGGPEATRFGLPDAPR
ncbi:hypothetical protein [Nocardioides dokdonensis]|uniref:hypothetical protein n=1 Tax=Nocardioides dokdonensis TaxID=450734 RepID=UPI000B134885|nr:hypothetical protein [Nocardioides dokdonensis]